MAKKTPAKKKTSSAPKKFAGLKVTVTGSLNHWPSTTAAKEAIKQEGGKLVDVLSADCDLLVVGKTRGSGQSSTEKRAHKLNAQGASIRIVDENAVIEMFRMTRDEALLLLRSRSKQRWNRLIEIGILGSPDDLTDLKEARDLIDLEGADLHDLDLTGFDFSSIRIVAKEGNLRGAKLSKANLEGANLEGANLEGANLEGANLEGANLERANLEGANLEGADLRKANLEDANLRGTSLEGADLRKANLEGANLMGASLTDAQISGASFENEWKHANLLGALW